MIQIKHLLQIYVIQITHKKMLKTFKFYFYYLIKYNILHIYNIKNFKSFCLFYLGFFFLHPYVFLHAPPQFSKSQN